MFHSCFLEYAFDDITISLLTSSCTLHRRKFRINVSVHIRIRISVLGCGLFSISSQVQCRLKISVNDISTNTFIDPV